jgi:hypothetical protein
MDLRGHLQQLCEQLGPDRARKLGLSEQGLDSLFEPDILNHPWTVEANRWALLGSCSSQPVGEVDPSSERPAVAALLDLELLDKISKLAPLEGSAAASESALVATAALRPLDEADFVWDVPSNLHGCSLGGARLTLRRDGSASWRGVVNSIYHGDAYCVQLTFLNSGGRELFRWGRFCSQSLTQHLQVWTNNNLSFPDYLFDSIAIASRRDHC